LKQQFEDKPSDGLGGLRRVAHTTSRMVVSKDVGDALRKELGDLLDANPDTENSAITALGTDSTTPLSDTQKGLVVDCMTKTLQALLPRSATACVQSENCMVNTALLSLWRQAAVDPDDQPEQWLVDGAPAGLLRPILDRGVFPIYDPEVDIAEVDAHSLVTEAEFGNYTGVEDNPLVAEEIFRMRDRGYSQEFDTIAAAEAAVGGRIVLSRIGAIERLKNGKIRMRVVTPRSRESLRQPGSTSDRACLRRCAWFGTRWSSLQRIQVANWSSSFVTTAMLSS
jgi:hypothetical protein